MARVVVSEFVSLDGVMEDPGGPEALLPTLNAKLEGK